MSRGWSSVEAPGMVLGLSRVMGVGLAWKGDKALGSHSAGVLDSHTALNGVVVLDTNRALKTAEVEDIREVLDADIDEEQGVGFAARRTLDIGQDVVEDRSLAVDVARIVASTLDRRHPRRTVEHSSVRSL